MFNNNNDDDDDDDNDDNNSDCDDDDDDNKDNDDNNNDNNTTTTILIMSVFYSTNFKQWQIAMLKRANDIRHIPDTSWHLTKCTQYDKMQSCIMNMQH